MGQDHRAGDKGGGSADKLGLLGSGEFHTGWWEGEALGGVEKAQKRLKKFCDNHGDSQDCCHFCNDLLT